MTAARQRKRAQPRFVVALDPRLPRIAVDLGYSAAQRSCGLVSSHSGERRSLRFGECVNAVTALIEAHGPHTLILEAVLSTFHRPDGNPDIRGDFEKGRGWYYGPGVTTFAAAQRLLQELDQRLSPSIAPIPLVEGFLSFKAARTTHTEDASRLLHEFDRATVFTPRAGSLPILPILDGAPEIRCYNARPGKRGAAKRAR
jgi:hypothetical protein